MRDRLCDDFLDLIRSSFGRPSPFLCAYNFSITNIFSRFSSACLMLWPKRVSVFFLRKYLCNAFRFQFRLWLIHLFFVRSIHIQFHSAVYTLLVQESTFRLYSIMNCIHICNIFIFVVFLMTWLFHIFVSLTIAVLFNYTFLFHLYTIHYYHTVQVVE